jgi:hypothetical protein
MHLSKTQHTKHFQVSIERSSILPVNNKNLIIFDIKGRVNLSTFTVTQQKQHENVLALVITTITIVVICCPPSSSSSSPQQQHRHHR